LTCEAVISETHYGFDEVQQLAMVAAGPPLSVGKHTIPARTGLSTIVAISEGLTQNLMPGMLSG
jgi:hypothetical protein